MTFFQMFFTFAVLTFLFCFLCLFIKVSFSITFYLFFCSFTFIILILFSIGNRPGHHFSSYSFVVFKVEVDIKYKHVGRLINLFCIKTRTVAIQT